MSEVVIRAEGLGKAYQIRHEAERRHDRFSEMLAERARRLFRRGGEADPTRETFWALRDVSFEVREGEVVGIIGRNGAGKSTLLKVLSRITEPTEGRVELRGRVASLLEVGTGFHPELTGRENVFLNGAILGMSRAEIRRKFDEIVDFAGVEKFLDTPVKRYSSGMRVRLAFAVAAHLEPEILVVDEVLAVGDAEFQRKCLGKMGEVAKGGRTVLFVSHNMTAVQRLCQRTMLMSEGRLTTDGETETVIGEYLAQNRPSQIGGEILGNVSREGSGTIRFKSVFILDSNDERVDNLVTGKACKFILNFNGERFKPGKARIGISIKNTQRQPLILFSNEISCADVLMVGRSDVISCSVPKIPLTEGNYVVDLFLEIDGNVEDWICDAFSFDVHSGSFFGTSKNAPTGWHGKSVLVEHSWERIVTEGVKVYEAQ